MGLIVDIHDQAIIHELHCARISAVSPGNDSETWRSAKKRFGIRKFARPCLRESATSASARAVHKRYRTDWFPEDH